MKSCPPEDIIIQYVVEKESIPEERQQEIQEHIAHCPLCAQLENNYSIISQPMNTEKLFAAEIPTSLNFLEGVLRNKIKTEHGGNRRKMIYRVALMACFFLIISLPLYIYRLGPLNVSQQLDNSFVDIYSLTYDIKYDNELLISDDSLFYMDIQYNDTTNIYTSEELRFIENNFSEIQILSKKGE